jgi:hypothetical protein
VFGASRVEQAERHDLRERVRAREGLDQRQEPGLVAQPVDLVDREHARGLLRQRRDQLGVLAARRGRRLAAAGVEQRLDVGHQQRHVRPARRLERGCVHAPAELALRAVDPGRVQEGDLRVRPRRDPEQPLAGGLRARRDDGQSLADRRVQKRRLSDVRAADDCYGSKAH